MTDLRGYGDSSHPQDGENHAGYSKRAMALDHIEVMRALGFKTFAVVGHDRGARVAWRMAVEHAEAVTRAVVIDIVPLPYSRVTRQFATEYFHWFFLIQPAPFSGNPHRQQRRVLPAFTVPAPERRGERGHTGSDRGVPAVLHESGDDPLHVRGLPRWRHHRPGPRGPGRHEARDVPAAGGVTAETVDGNLHQWPSN